MPKTDLRLVRFGSAHALTRDGFGGPYTEIQVLDSRDPAA
jgi:hypothetical protein